MDDEDDFTNITLTPKSSHPPALYYLPKVLTPSQEAFLGKRRKLAERRIAEEKAEWDSERRKGLEEVRNLKEASDTARAQASEALKTTGDQQSARDASSAPDVAKEDASIVSPSAEVPQDQEMTIEEKIPSVTPTAESEPVAMEGVDEDAVEY